MTAVHGEPDWVTEDLKEDFATVYRQTGSKQLRATLNHRFQNLSCAQCLKKRQKCVPRQSGFQCQHCLPHVSYLRHTEGNGDDTDTEAEREDDHPTCGALSRTMSTVVTNVSSSSSADHAVENLPVAHPSENQVEAIIGSPSLGATRVESFNVGASRDSAAIPYETLYNRNSLANAALPFDQPRLEQSDRLPSLFPVTGQAISQALFTPQSANSSVTTDEQEQYFTDFSLNTRGNEMTMPLEMAASDPQYMCTISQYDTIDTSARFAGFSGDSFPMSAARGTLPAIVAPIPTLPLPEFVRTATPDEMMDCLRGVHDLPSNDNRLNVQSAPFLSNVSSFSGGGQGEFSSDTSAIFSTSFQTSNYPSLASYNGGPISSGSVLASGIFPRAMSLATEDGFASAVAGGTANASNSHSSVQCVDPQNLQLQNDIGGDDTEAFDSADN
ncbi:hypothetical protein GYMLUDRAFT_57624 [Collybiopsis luxurians FD-317 M1]|uniref:Uncharacterized protein n=1 Tax=Collybiopsis luxurians FD-317 M1 TaxID=944289 RepID=A0A0D0BHF3_9AGAR|nr:hypothetical protein GYMLUDRAFT_57624 [Collybiopsis luxurians FD-317 M1]